MSQRVARIWINVTTSVNWTRPPVGIVRVERALVEHLQKQLGEDVCRLCVWNDDRFTEWVPMATEIPPRISQALDVIVPRGPSFDIVRPYVVKALGKYSRATARRSGTADEMELLVPLDGVALLHPAPGDFLLSVGLDWDNVYTKHFFRLAKKQGLRIITCCYDLIPVLFPQYCVGEVAQKFTEYFLELSWGSEAVLCISEQTRKDYTRLCNELGAPMRRTVVIPLGDNLPSGESAIGDSVRAATECPFILFVSTIERRKNHEVLYRAYHILRRRGVSGPLPRLIFVGMPGWGVSDLLQDIELDPLTRGLIVQLNHVSDAELAHLYQKALFCVFPSLYEGWGLPVGEALAMGKAVVASAEGSLPEVGGDLVHYLPAWNPYEWADTIQAYVEHPDLIAESERKVRAGYKPRRWSDTARTVRELIEDLAATSVGNSLDLLAGYDMSTECGIHSGTSIISSGSPGLLLFGPHRALRRGRYRVCVYGSVLREHREPISIDVVSQQGQAIHASTHYQRSREDSGTDLKIEMLFSMERDAEDIEVLCRVMKGAVLQIDRVVVRSCA